MVQETGVQSQVKSNQRLKKWYLIPPGLTLGIIRYISRVKWINPGKEVAPYPTSQCSSYWKGSLQVALNFDRQPHFYFIQFNWLVFELILGFWQSFWYVFTDIHIRAHLIKDNRIFILGFFLFLFSFMLVQFTNECPLFLS